MRVKAAIRRAGSINKLAALYGARVKLGNEDEDAENGDNAEEDDEGDAAQDEAARPSRRLSTAVAQGMIDAEALEVVVFGVRGH